MKAKLGFGFITALEPDVLLIDETLGVGDMEFRERAKERVRDFIQKSGCVIISTHSIGLARELCNRGLVLESGKIISDEKIESYARLSQSVEGGIDLEKLHVILCDNRRLKIAVVGLGYVGLPTAIAFHESGFDVNGVDISENVIEKLKLGNSPLRMRRRL